MGALISILLVSYLSVREVNSPARDQAFRKPEQGKWDLDSGSLGLQSTLS